MQLTQKESDLLKDLKDAEKLCIEKYTKHAAAAKDTQLSQLFNQIAGVEKQHLSTLDKIGEGSVPQCGGGQSQLPMTFSPTYGTAPDPFKLGDSYLCSDILSMEKHVSHTYDTCVFEFKDEQLRCVLNEIQSDEQHHGKLIYDYMSVNNMYS